MIVDEVIAAGTLQFKRNLAGWNGEPSGHQAVWEPHRARLVDCGFFTALTYAT